MRIERLGRDGVALEGVARQPAAGKGLLAAVEKQPAVGAQPMGDARLAQQTLVFRGRQPDQRVERGSGLVEDTRARPVQKGQRPAQVLGEEPGVIAELRRCVLQQLGQRCPQSGVVERHQRAARQHPGIAVRGLAARRRAIEQRYRVAALLQLERTGHANDAGAQHGHCLFHAVKLT